MRRLLRALAYVALFLLVADASAGPAAQPSATWAKGDSWFIAVQHFPVEGKPVPFNVMVSISGSHREAGVERVYAIYIPRKGTPPPFTERHFVWIDKATSWPLKAFRVTKPPEVKIRHLGAAALLDVQPPPLPFVFLPLPDQDKTVFSDGTASLVLSRSRDGDDRIVQAVLTQDKKERWKCVQRWKPNAKWWSQSELWVDGRRDCLCTYTPPPPGGVAPPPGLAYLADKRLNVPVAVPAGLPTVGDLLAAVQEGSGVPLAADEAIRDLGVDLGSMNGRVQGWTLLGMAARPLQGASWRREGTGWHLGGKAAPGMTAPRGQLSPGMLHQDRRLHVLSRFVRENPTVAQTLEHLARTTRLEFTLDPKLARHAPRLGSVQFKNIQASSIMGMLASRDLLNGHWEKTPTGYRLTADESLNLGPLPADGASGLATDAPGPVRGGPPWWAIGSVGAIVVGLSGLFWWRFRKPAAAP